MINLLQGTGEVLRHAGLWALHSLLNHSQRCICSHCCCACCYAVVVVMWLLLLLLEVWQSKNVAYVLTVFLLLLLLHVSPGTTVERLG